MTPDFVRQHAPNLFIPMDDGGAGLDTEQPMYDRVTGMPSPWLREGNAPRQYFGDPELRGLQEPDFPMAPMEPQAAPMRSRAPVQAPAGYDETPPGLDVTGQPRTLVRPPANIPEVVRPTEGVSGLRGSTDSRMVDVLRSPQPDGMRERGRYGNTASVPTSPGNVAGYDSPALTGAERAMRSPQGTTLQDVLARFNFQIPTFDASMIPSFLSESRDGRLRGRSTENTIDNRGDTGTVQETSQRPGMGRAEEVAAFLRSQKPPIRITSVVRSGNARRRGHPMGNSIDIDPRDRTRADALIRQQFPDLAVEAIPIRRGQDFGNGVRATGDHVHYDFGEAAH